MESPVCVWYTRNKKHNCYQSKENLSCLLYMFCPTITFLKWLGSEMFAIPQFASTSNILIHVNCQYIKKIRKITQNSHTGLDLGGPSVIYQISFRSLNPEVVLKLMHHNTKCNLLDYVTMVTAVLDLSSFCLC